MWKLFCEVYLLGRMQRKQLSLQRGYGRTVRNDLRYDEKAYWVRYAYPRREKVIAKIGNDTVISLREMEKAEKSFVKRQKNLVFSSLWLDEFEKNKGIRIEKYLDVLNG